MKPLLLGVNIDHVATLREARGTRYPDPVYAALEAEMAGADGITLHLREDARHIQERDVRQMKALIQTRMNLELAITERMLTFAEEIKPEFTCFVPEKREELTTEGGLDVLGNLSLVTRAIERMQAVGSVVSLFIDPEVTQIDAAHAAGATMIELHTGAYADAQDEKELNHELQRIMHAAKYAANLNITVNAGHGLHYHNVQAIARIPELHELNIGHAIVAQALFSGFQKAVKDMRDLMREARYDAFH